MALFPSLLAVLGSLGPTARAGALVALPASEPQEDWAGALAAAGLDLAASGGPADIAVRAQGDRWWVELPGEAPLKVMPPASARERADLALLLASLAQPGEGLDWGVLGPAPTVGSAPGRAPRAEAPKAAPARPPPAPKEPAPPLPVAASVPPLSPPTLPVTPPPQLAPPAALTVAAPASWTAREGAASPRPAVPLSAWIEAGASASLRQEVRSSPTLGLGLGVRRGDWRFGARGHWTGASVLDALGEGRELRSAGLLGGGWWTPRWLALGAGVGLWRQVYLEEGAPIDQTDVPTAWLEPRLELPLPAGLRLGLGGLLSYDLRATELWVGGRQVAELARGSAQAGIWLSGRWGDQDSGVAPQGER